MNDDSIQKPLPAVINISSALNSSSLVRSVKSVAEERPYMYPSPPAGRTRSTYAIATRIRVPRERDTRRGWEFRSWRLDCMRWSTTGVEYDAMHRVLGLKFARPSTASIAGTNTLSPRLRPLTPSFLAPSLKPFKIKLHLLSQFQLTMPKGTRHPIPYPDITIGNWYQARFEFKDDDNAAAEQSSASSTTHTRNKSRAITAEFGKKVAVDEAEDEAEAVVAGPSGGEGAGTKRRPPDDRDGGAGKGKEAPTERAALSLLASGCTISEPAKKTVSMRTLTIACSTACFVRSCSLDLCRWT